MKRLWVILFVLAFAFVGVTPQTGTAKGKKAMSTAGEKESRWSGTIVRSSKDESTITVRKGTVERVIHYDSATKWTQEKGTKAADQSEFKDGSRVICLGKFNEKKEFVATQIDLRLPRIL